jgi:hypothetical protein
VISHILSRTLKSYARNHVYTHVHAHSQFQVRLLSLSLMRTPALTLTFKLAL